MMLAEYEHSLEQKLKESDDYIEQLAMAEGWDVDVNEDGPFIVSIEGGIT